MKKIIYPIGVFESEWEITVPEQRQSYGIHDKIFLSQPHCEIRKTSPCRVRYQLDPEDRMRFNELSRKIDKAIIDFRKQLITQIELNAILSPYDRIKKMYDKAVTGIEEVESDVVYIEVADSSSRGCYAYYRTSFCGHEAEKGCKVGENLEINIKI